MHAHANLAHPMLTLPPRTENVEAEGWIKAGAEGHDFYVTEFRHPRFFSVAATIAISPSTTTYQLRKKGFSDWKSKGLYGIGHVSPEGLITVTTPSAGGRYFPKRTKEIYLDLVARALGFEEPRFVGKPDIAADHVTRRQAEAIGRGELKLETRTEREMRTGDIHVRLSDGTTRRFHEPRAAMDWADAQIKGKPGARALVYREGYAGGPERPITGFEANEYGRVHQAPVHASGWSVTGEGNRAGSSASSIADQLTERQRATLAWLIENWPYPYRGSPHEDVDPLVAMGLLEPYTAEEWGGPTRLGRDVWRRARRQWRRETNVGAHFKYARNPR